MQIQELRSQSAMCKFKVLFVLFLIAYISGSANSYPHTDTSAIVHHPKSYYYYSGLKNTVANAISRRMLELPVTVENAPESQGSTPANTSTPLPVVSNASIFREKLLQKLLPNISTTPNTFRENLIVTANIAQLNPNAAAQARAQISKDLPPNNIESGNPNLANSSSNVTALEKSRFRSGLLQLLQPPITTLHSQPTDINFLAESQISSVTVHLDVENTTENSTPPTTTTVAPTTPPPPPTTTATISEPSIVMGMGFRGKLVKVAENHFVKAAAAQETTTNATVDEVIASENPVLATSEAALPLLPEIPLPSESQIQDVSTTTSIPPAVPAPESTTEKLTDKIEASGSESQIRIVTTTTSTPPSTPETTTEKPTTATKINILELSETTPESLSTPPPTESSTLKESGSMQVVIQVLPRSPEPTTLTSTSDDTPKLDFTTPSTTLTKTEPTDPSYDVEVDDLLDYIFQTRPKNKTKNKAKQPGHLDPGVSFNDLLQDTLLLSSFLNPGASDDADVDNDDDEVVAPTSAPKKTSPAQTVLKMMANFAKNYNPDLDSEELLQIYGEITTPKTTTTTTTPTPKTSDKPAIANVPEITIPNTGGGSDPFELLADLLFPLPKEETEKDPTPSSTNSNANFLGTITSQLNIPALVRNLLNPENENLNSGGAPGLVLNALLNLNSGASGSEKKVDPASVRPSITNSDTASAAGEKLEQFKSFRRSDPANGLYYWLDKNIFLGERFGGLQIRPKFGQRQHFINVD